VTRKIIQKKNATGKTIVANTERGYIDAQESFDEF
jgi:hypothetical protein